MSSRVDPQRSAARRARSARVATTLLLGASTFVCSQGLAQTPAAEQPAATAAMVAPEESAKIEQARAAFAQGIELARQGRWVDALAELTRSNALHPHAVTTYNIGYCERSLGRYTRARKMLSKALADNQASGGQELSEDLTSAATKLLSEAAQQVATINVTIRPATAALKVDGRPLELVSASGARPVASASTREVGEAEVAPAESFDLLIDPGTHEFVVSASDHDVTVITRSFEPGSHAAIQLTGHQEPEPTAAVASPPRALPPASKPNRAPAWIAFGVGGLGAVVGSVSGALAFAQKGRVADACPDAASCADKRRTGNREADISTGSFIVFGAGAIVGTILFMTAGKQHTNSADASTHAKRYLRPFVGSGTLGVDGSF
jgi:hypothetical protein